MDDILLKLVDLYQQSITEHTHYYTASVLIDAITEIMKLRKELRDERTNKSRKQTKR